MIYYQISEIFTLIPKQLYNKAEGERVLQQIFSIGPSYIAQSIDITNHNATLCYAVHQDTIGKTNSADKVYPFVYKLLSLINESNNYNNAIFHYNSEINLCHIIICEGKELKIANSFKCDNFNTALYFLILSVKKLNMNPKQTKIRVCYNITNNDAALMKRFFNGIEMNLLDNSDII